MRIITSDNRVIKFVELFPNSWKTIGRKMIIDVTAFYLNVADNFSLDNHIKKIDLKGSRIIIFHGSIEYLDDSFKIIYADSTKIKGESKTEKDYIALCFTLLDKETSSPRISQSTLGLISAYLGQYMLSSYIYSKQYEYEFLENRKYKTHSDHTVVNISKEKSLQITNSPIEKLKTAIQKIHKLDIKTQRRILLSLNWYTKSFSEDFMNSFLVLWFAIETVSLTSVNIKEGNLLLIKNIICRMTG